MTKMSKMTFKTAIKKLLMTLTLSDVHIAEHNAEFSPPIFNFNSSHSTVLLRVILTRPSQLFVMMTDFMDYMHTLVFINQLDYKM